MPSYGVKDEMVKTEIWIEDGVIGKRTYPVYDSDGEEYALLEVAADPLTDVSAEISSEAFYEISDILMSPEYAAVPDEIQTDIADGDFVYIIFLGTGEEGDPSSMKGGLGAGVAGPKAFKDACEAIEELAAGIDFEKAIEDTNYYRYYGTYKDKTFTLSIRDMEGMDWGNCDYTISFS